MKKNKKQKQTNKKRKQEEKINTCKRNEKTRAENTSALVSDGI